ncbi:MAG TPA: ABC transporter permease [Candidatus Acidoferrales bacterium]|nr:ABC transporter permease [Candidatus Acidoferrales bacterium]
MMRALRRTWKRLLGSSGRGDHDLADELNCHLQFLTDENIRRGLSPEEAQRQARLTFGSVESAKEDYRQQRGFPFIETTIRDLQYAFRGVRRNPGFALVAILSLGVGIGASTAVFSLIDSVLLRPLAFQNPQRVFAVRESNSHFAVMPVNPVHASDWASECSSLQEVALVRANRTELGSGGEPISLNGADVSYNIFHLFGVEPILGRTFRSEEQQEGNDHVVILSESLWRSRFNADATLIGRSILLDRQNYRVVGIMPASFQLPHGMASANSVRFDIFHPLVVGQDELARLMGNFNYGAFVRLRHGITTSQALSEINVVEARFPRLAGRNEKLTGVLIPIREFVTGRAELGLWMLACAVGAVLLIVCVNLANLLLARIASRSREAAIRTALGASRGRQLRQVLTECLLLSFLGGTLGIILAALGIRLLLATTSLDIPRLDQVRLNSTVFVFAFCLALFTGFLFGILPAWRLTRGDPQQALRAGSHTSTEAGAGLRLRKALIGMEVGLSAALLIVAGLLMSSLVRLLSVDKGFDADRILTADFSLSGDIYTNAATRANFFNRLLPKLNAIPGVQASGMITQLPIRGETWNDPIYLEGTPPESRHPVDNRYASPGYFRVMNIPVRQGKAFDESDRDRHVAVLSEEAAALLWPGDPDPVGRTFMGEDDKATVLIGIVGEVRAQLGENPPPTAYYPWWQRPPDGGSVVLRTTADPRSVVGSLRAAFRSEDPQLPIETISTMDQLVDVSLAQRRFQLTLMGAFAFSALLVAALGIYGIISYSVARRRNEIGIRLALGAQRHQVLGLILRQGMAPVIAGLTAGVMIALFVGRIIRGLLFGVEPADPLTILGAAVVLLGVGALACLIPARRAASTDVIMSLRVE